MKIKDGFVLTALGEEYVAVPVGERNAQFHGIVRLNDTGAFIWKALAENLNSEQITEKLLEEYEVDRQTAEKAVNRLIKKLKDNGLVEE